MASEHYATRRFDRYHLADPVVAVHITLPAASSPFLPEITGSGSDLAKGTVPVVQQFQFSQMP